MVWSFPSSISLNGVSDSVTCWKSILVYPKGVEHHLGMQLIQKGLCSERCYRNTSASGHVTERFMDSLLHHTPCILCLWKWIHLLLFCSILVPMSCRCKWQWEFQRKKKSGPSVHAMTPNFSRARGLGNVIPLVWNTAQWERHHREQ